MKNDVDGFLAGYESGHPYREHYLNHFDYMRRLDEAPNYPIATTLAASVFSFFTNPGENKGTHLNTER